MKKVEVVYSFQDIHTGQIYNAGDVVTFSDDRLMEINQNLPGFVLCRDDLEDVEEMSAGKKRLGRKKKEVTNELPETETDI